MTDELREEILDDMRKLGRRYLDDGDVDEALRWLKSAALLGSTRADVELGKIYRCGHDVEKNIPKAIFHYERAALSEDRDAIFALGEIYRDGEGTIKPDGAKAVRHFARLATHNDDDARFALGCMYLYGHGVAKDVAKTASYFDGMKEINCLYTSALFTLAEKYRTGDGVERDVAKAVTWYEKIIDCADDLSREKSLFALAEIYFLGDGVEKNLERAEYFLDEIRDALTDNSEV